MTISVSTMRPPRAPSGLRRQKRQRARARAEPGAPARPRSARRATVVRVSTWLATTSVPDPRVEEGVAGVHEEVHQDDHADDEQIDALDDGIVTLVDRIEEKAPHARQPEDRLEDDGAAQDLRDLDAEDRDHRDQRVLQTVLEHDRALARSLRPGRAHVVLTENFQERGPGESN